MDFRRKIKLSATFYLMISAVSVCAQAPWFTPPPNSPQVIIGYMHFHLGLADAIKHRSAVSSRQLSQASQRMLGISAAEFDVLTSGYRAAIDAYSASMAAQRDVSVNARSRFSRAREQTLAANFAAALRGISEKDAANVVAYMNGPFRANIKSRQASGRAR
jgi:hypothetical protein